MHWLYGLVATTALGMLLIVFGIARSRQRMPSLRLRAVLSDVAEKRPRVVLPERPSTSQMVDNWLTRIGLLVSRLYGSDWYQRTERALGMAGRPFGLDSYRFLGLQVAAAAVFGVFGTFVAWGSQSPGAVVVFTSVMVAPGFAAPWLWIRFRSAARQRQIERDLPDMLDMLCLCLDAGLGLEAAIVSACRRWRGPLTDELKLVLAEVQLGWPRPEALRHMLQRTEVPQLTAVVGALIQADQLGTSIKNTLHLQAIDARGAYRRKVREAGYKVPIRMIVPTTLFILPAIFIVIIGPVVPQLMRSLGG